MITMPDTGLHGYVTLPADAREKYAARMRARGEVCGWCGELPGRCADDCGCDHCEVSRALDDDADMARGMIDP
jgi:hypothetical protein